MANTEFEYGEKRDNLKLIKIDTDDTIAEMVRKINDNFGNLAMHGGGPEGKQGIQGIDGVDGVGYSVILSSPCVYIKCDKNWKAIEDDETHIQLFYYENDKSADINVSFDEVDKETSKYFSQSYDSKTNTRKIIFTHSGDGDSDAVDFVFEKGNKKKIDFTIKYGDMEIDCSWTLIPYQSK